MKQPSTRFRKSLRNEHGVLVLWCDLGADGELDERSRRKLRFWAGGRTDAGALREIGIHPTGTGRNVRRGYFGRVGGGFELM